MNTSGCEGEAVFDTKYEQTIQTNPSKFFSAANTIAAEGFEIPNNSLCWQLKPCCQQTLLFINICGTRLLAGPVATTNPMSKMDIFVEHELLDSMIAGEGSKENHPNTSPRLIPSLYYV